jgi:hypothetical protein
VVRLWLAGGLFDL